MYNTPDNIKCIILGIISAVSAYVHFDVFDFFFYLNLLRSFFIELIIFRIDKLYILRMQIFTFILAAWCLVVIWQLKLWHFLFGRFIKLRARNVIQLISYWKLLTLLLDEGLLLGCWFFTHCLCCLIDICVGVFIEHHR